MQTGLLQLERRKYGVGISWDRAVKDVDLDLQVIIVDHNGHITEAVFHNNLTGAGGGVIHSGDSKKGKGEDAYGELVWVDFSKIQLKVKLLIFVVAAHSGGHLVDVRKGMISVVEAKREGHVDVLRSYMMENSTGDVDAVVMMKRNTYGRWAVEPIDRWAEEGESFLDLLDVLSDIIRSEIPTAPKTQEVNFSMEKNGVVDRNVGSQRTIGLEMKSYAVVLSWDDYEPGGETDCLTLLLDKAGHIINVASRVSCNCMNGAVLRCENEDDGEGTVRAGLTVQLDLQALEGKAHLLVFVLVTGYHATLGDLTNMSLLLLDQAEDKSKARLSIQVKNPAGHSKVLVAFQHIGPRRWAMVERFCLGQAANNLPDLMPYLHGVIRDYIPDAPPVQQMTRCALIPGQGIPIPYNQGTTLQLVVRWALDPEAGKLLQLGVGMMVFDKQAKLLTTLESSHVNTNCSVVTVGSQGSGSERCSCSFQLQPAEASKSVSQVVLILTAATGLLKSIKGLTVSLSVGDISVAHFSLPGSKLDRTGLVLARLARMRDRSWAFQAVGTSCSGTSPSDPDILEPCENLALLEVQSLQPVVRVSEDSPALISDSVDIEKALVDHRTPTSARSIRNTRAAEPIPEVPTTPKAQLLLASLMVAHRRNRRHKAYDSANGA
eukprot:CAMPEP_0206439042 /NCGR_PEP_ID=MMETSP0324_2-20121206/11982_1 /ASSEMBLY_ACC=CAM_ASM_000836 /TAXON_ID=2866 /ORGANISM="Crypthecodinium cohnii, Strain Seligo" /LENGTH=659 /DNA_ID=CAMNT_0053906601 /DNA_START=41 /DNA_END=2016 /DNA_ORIENTATION=-